MKRFKKGERVRCNITGNVMEVLKYLNTNTIEVKSFDVSSLEVHIDEVEETSLSKAA